MNRISIAVLSLLFAGSLFADSAQGDLGAEQRHLHRSGMAPAARSESALTLLGIGRLTERHATLVLVLRHVPEPDKALTESRALITTPAEPAQKIT